MGKVVILVGKSASGKSSIEKVLENYGLKRIISTTTRPKRQGEIEGVDYHFITESDFNKGLKNNDFWENNTYRNWLYGIDKKYNKIDLTNQDYVCVTNPHGYRQIVNSIGKDNIICFYIWAEDKERLLRSLHREEHPDVQEIVRRYNGDQELFLNFEKEANYTIENRNISDAMSSILDILESKVKIIGSIDDLKVGDKVKIIKILNMDKVEHLARFIGREGFVFSWLVKGYAGEKRYKVFFDDIDGIENLNETAYFKRSELQFIEG